MTISPRRPWLLLFLALGLLAGCGPSGGSGKATTSGGTGGGRAGDESLESARQLLLGGTERANNNLALLQVNNYLAQHPERRAPPPSAEARALLEKSFGLDKGELDEVVADNYTALDAQHMDLCFLVRDGARSLEAERLTPAEKAAAGFAWVVRQVVLQDLDNEPAPPDFVLRRGRGSALERAYVFLAVLHQLGVPGCLVTSPGVAQPWACGALVEGAGKEKQILLFDHRLGLPLPGPKGAPDDDLARAFRRALPVAGPRDGVTVATLAALRRQPDLLAALKADEKTAYDITEEQIKAARVELALPLSALAPRLRVLQDDLLPPAISVRLAADAGDLLRAFGAAAGAEGGVDVRREAVALLRRFLPEEEGGTDKENRKIRFLRTLVPRQALPAQVQALEGEPRQFIEMQFISMFVGTQMERGTPRDQVLRGQYKEASEALTQILEQARVLKSVREITPELDQEFRKWVAEIKSAYGDLERAQMAARKGGPPEEVEAAKRRIADTWKAHQKTLSLLVNGSAAEPRRAQSMFLQAQGMHEQAERAQGRLESLSPAAEAADGASAKAAAAAAWRESAGWCESFLQEFPTTPFGGTAQLLLARAQDALGNAGRARAILEDLPGATSGTDRVARLYLARRLKK